MYQSGYLESDMWEDGFVDPHIWLTELGAPNIISGAYNPITLDITASGENFFLYPGVLYYRKDGGPWVTTGVYDTWTNGQIIMSVPLALLYGTYDLKVVRSDAQEDTLLNAFDVDPSTSSDYYVDVNQVATGAGTEASPWNLAQLKLYLADAPTYFPVDGDIVNIKGDIPIDTVNAYMFLVDPGDSIEITLRAWDKSTNGLWTVTTPNSGHEIFRIASSDVTLNVSDMVVIPQDTAGSGPSDLIIAKSTDNTSGPNSVILRGSMIISDQEVHMTGASTTEKTNITAYGCNFSFEDAAFEINEYSDTTLVYDSVINLQGTASINDSGGTLTWDHCETNVVTGLIPGTKTDCTFSNSSIDDMPTSLTATTFLENDFNYYIYEITNSGNGSVFWIANGILLDIKGYTRAGIGAFRFEAYSYYVDGEKGFSGDGSESDQFMFRQLRNYFDNTEGDSCGVSPTGYDTFLLKNIFTPVDNFFINVNEEIGGYSFIKAADIGRDKAWFIETKDYAPADEFIIIQIDTSTNMKKLIVKDFILTQNTEDTNTIVTVDSLGVSQKSYVHIKNAMLYCKSADIFFSSFDGNMDVSGEGLTIKTPGDFITTAETGSIVDLIDSVVKAGELYDTLGGGGGPPMGA